MIKIQKTQFTFSEDEVTESEITVEKACRILHELSWYGNLGSKIICESDEDKQQLVKTYYHLYHDEFNIRHNIDDKEQQNLQLAYPATNDVFYVENSLFRFEAGIRELDSSYARVNTHETSFTFQMTPIHKCISIDNAPDEQTENRMSYLQQYIIYKHEQLNHPSYDNARNYLEQVVWPAYQELFTDSPEMPDINRIIDINKNFDLPWYDRL